MKLLLPLALAGVLLAPLASAHSVSGTYEAPATPNVSLLCSPCGLAGFDVGGVMFPAIPETPTSVAIADATGGPVGFMVCQDTNNNGLCDTAGEPRVEACGRSASLGGSTVPFRAGNATAVFVFVAQPFACAGAVATTGTVTLTYAP